MTTREHHLALREAHHIADSEAYFKARAELNTYGGRTAFEAGYQRGFDAAEKLYATQATAEDFEEGQWWLKELDAMVANGTHDQKRAVAVVRNLLATAKKQQPQTEAVRIYDYVWPQNDRFRDECVYACSYTPARPLAEGKLLAVVHPSQIPNSYLQREGGVMNTHTTPVSQQTEAITTPKPEGPRNAVLKDSDFAKPGESS